MAGGWPREPHRQRRGEKKKKPNNFVSQKETGWAGVGEGTRFRLHPHPALLLFFFFLKQIEFFFLGYQFFFLSSEEAIATVGSRRQNPCIF